MQLENIPRAWDTTGREAVGIPPMERVPTVEEVRDILAPWRPPYVRQAALFIWKNHDDEAFRLRTHYGDGDDKFTQWREIDEDMDPRFEEDLVPLLFFDDPQVFNFGENWERIFDILPELAGPEQGYTRAIAEGRLYEDFLALQQKALQQKLRENVIRAEDKEEEIECGVGQDLQFMAVEAYLIVADREAFETDQLRILYLDARGNIVRHSRLPPEEVAIAREKWNAGKFRDSEWWIEERWSSKPGSIIGEKYKARGEIGRVLYGVEDLL